MTLDASLFDEVVREADRSDEIDPNYTYNSDDEVVQQEHKE